MLTISLWTGDKSWAAAALPTTSLIGRDRGGCVLIGRRGAGGYDEIYRVIRRPWWGHFSKQSHSSIETELPPICNSLSGLASNGRGASLDRGHDLGPFWQLVTTIGPRTSPLLSFNYWEQSCLLLLQQEDVWEKRILVRNRETERPASTAFSTPAVRTASTFLATSTSTSTDGRTPAKQEMWPAVQPRLDPAAFNPKYKKIFDTKLQNFNKRPRSRNLKAFHQEIQKIVRSRNEVVVAPPRGLWWAGAGLFTQNFD